MKVIHIAYAGPFQKIVDSTGKEWFFEMHSYCGPVVLKKDGDPMKNQPNEKSDFWEVVSRWVRQGKKVTDGYCEYV